MKVVDLHPEELIDKLASGELSPAERVRLNDHLALCPSCRLELQVRADLAQEIPLFEERPQLTFGTAPLLERAAPGPAVLTRPAGVSPSLRARSRRRWPLVMLAAALVLCAGGATAAVLSGAVQTRWLSWAPMPKSSVPASQAASAKSAHPLKRAAPKVSPPSEASAANPVALDAAASSAPVNPPSTPLVVGLPALSAHAAGSSSSAGARLAALPHSAPGGSRAAFPEVATTAEPSPPARDEALASRKTPAAGLFADANRARRDGNADRAVALYRALQSRYPSSAESELSRALLAQLLLDRGSPEAALAGFDRYLAEDTPVLGAEALVGRARALEQLGKSAQAVLAWQAVQRKFPGSVHARLAVARLTALGMR